MAVLSLKELFGQTVTFAADRSVQRLTRTFQVVTTHDDRRPEKDARIPRRRDRHPQYHYLRVVRRYRDLSSATRDKDGNLTANWLVRVYYAK